MKILVIAAHPDDEVYGMGGTIAKLSEAGDEVHVLIVTDGCTAQYRNDPRLPQILAQKQEEAAGQCPAGGESGAFRHAAGHAAGYRAPCGGEPAH